jgi:hypothetical protein
MALGAHPLVLDGVLEVPLAQVSLSDSEPDQDEDEAEERCVGRHVRSGYDIARCITYTWKGRRTRCRFGDGASINHAGKVRMIEPRQREHSLGSTNAVGSLSSNAEGSCTYPNEHEPRKYHRRVIATDRLEGLRMRRTHGFEELPKTQLGDWPQ